MEQNETLEKDVALALALASGVYSARELSDPFRRSLRKAFRSRLDDLGQL